MQSIFIGHKTAGLQNVGGSDKRQLMLGYQNVQVKKVNVFWIKEYIQQWGTVWLAET